MSAEDARVSKHAKYSSPNPISRRLVKGFMAAIEGLVVPLRPTSILDVGCGEGLVLKSLWSRLSGARCAAIDVDPAEVADAARNLAGCEVRVGSVYEIPFESTSFDLVMCCEVLEHLDRPEAALRELGRVSGGHVLVSVPREPIWRGLNMLRGAYLTRRGNTPGHLNHWSGRSFETFVGRELDVVRRVSPLPWTIVLARKR